MKKCNSCGHKIDNDMTFCGKCGTRAESPHPAQKTCQNCGNTFAGDMIFCDKCGARYEQSAAAFNISKEQKQPTNEKIEMLKAERKIFIDQKIKGLKIAGVLSLSFFFFCLLMPFIISFFLFIFEGEDDVIGLMIACMVMLVPAVFFRLIGKFSIKSAKKLKKFQEEDYMIEIEEIVKYKNKPNHYITLVNAINKKIEKELLNIKENQP